MSNQEVDRIIKRIQSRVNRELSKIASDLKCTKDDVRSIYTSEQVGDLENPTELEYLSVCELIIEDIKKRVGNTEDKSIENPEELTSVLSLQKEETTDVRSYVDSDPNLVDTTLDDVSSLAVKEENEQKGDLNLCDKGPVESKLSVQKTIEDHFKHEKLEVPDLILDFAEERAIKNIDALDKGLEKVNETELHVLFKIADDHNKTRKHNYKTFEKRLNSVSEQDEKKLSLKWEQRITRLKELENRYNTRTLE